MRFVRPAACAFFAAWLLLALGCETTSSSPSPTATSSPSASATPTGTARPRPSREPAYVSLERTTNSAGAPAGPVYVVTLFDDGKVLFEGHASVKSKGTFSRTIPRETAAAIFGSIESMNLWQRPRRYDEDRANRGGDSVIVRTASNEVPWDILRARSHGQMLRIDGLFFAPQDILDLKQRIEEAVGLADWIGQPHEWQR